MNSIVKILAFVGIALFVSSCSSMSGHSQKTTQTVDFEGLQKKAQLVSARTADLKKYKVREVSF